MRTHTTAISTLPSRYIQRRCVFRINFNRRTETIYLYSYFFKKCSRPCYLRANIVRNSEKERKRDNTNHPSQFTGFTIQRSFPHKQTVCYRIYLLTSPLNIRTLSCQILKLNQTFILTFNEKQKMKGKTFHSIVLR